MNATKFRKYRLLNVTQDQSLHEKRSNILNVISVCVPSAERNKNIMAFEYCMLGVLLFYTRAI